MHLDRYEFDSDKTAMVFEFTSKGKKGLIPKVIIFSETNLTGIYNLAFGDKDVTTGDFDDLVVSNNGDTERILATIVAAVYKFTDKNDALVYAEGSTKTRTRLYRIGITKYLNEIKNDFDILGLRNNQWEVFVKAIDYDAFLVKRKKSSNFTL